MPYWSWITGPFPTPLIFRYHLPLRPYKASMWKNSKESVCPSYQKKNILKTFFLKNPLTQYTQMFLGNRAIFWFWPRDQKRRSFSWVLNSIFIVSAVSGLVRTVQRGRVLREQTPTDPNQKERIFTWPKDNRSLVVASFLLPTLSVKWT
jgi:hypothetical protein